jgi:hypothetical protein
VFSYEPSENTHSEWYTPPYVFAALECTFDLDPASPGRDLVPWLPARTHYTRAGLERPWSGFVWMNCPYGRGVIDLWTARFAEHADGIALVQAATSTRWWQALVERADMILFMSRKIAFINAAGETTGAFPIGSTLVAIGPRGVAALLTAARNGLGIVLAPHKIVVASRVIGVEKAA